MSIADQAKKIAAQVQEKVQADAAKMTKNGAGATQGAPSVPTAEPAPESALVPKPGMSTTTKVALGAGAVAAAFLLLRN